MVMNISDRIKELRKKTGLSQSKFSAKFGIPVRTLQQWEQGISAPPEYLIRMMAYIMLLEKRRDENEELTGGKKNADKK
ncbi:MAG: helix-turn-helix domain-containing protein [Lachnospiraceae bacterium]|nr:helix-turn-helix domain-containing protein [Lachnospiraceae bacterium]